MNCPDCGQPTLDADEFPSWCPACDWNVLTGIKPPAGRAARMYARISRRLGTGLLDEQVARRPARPRWTLAIVVAHLHAAAVLAVVLALPAAAVVLIVSGWPHWEAFALALIPLAVFWVVRPRPANVPDDWRDAEVMPTVVALVEQCAAALGADPPHRVMISAQWNASFLRAGWRRRPIVMLGLPLFGALPPQARAALIGHELAHGLNGDPARRLLPITALRALFGGAALLRPDVLARARAQHQPSVAFANFIMDLGADMLSWMGELLLQLCGRESQRAEFLADAMAATVAGSDGAIELTELVTLDATFLLVVQRHALTELDSDLLEDVRTAMEDVPLVERQRLLRASELADIRLDASHPPTAHRLAALRAHPCVPAVVVTQQQTAALDGEMAGQSARLTRELVDRWRSRLTHRYR